MLKLSRTVEYAVQAVLLLAKANPSEPVPCSQLATKGGMPQRFLLQVLRSLVLHEVVDSTRGVDGGYSLARLPSEITLLDVFEAIEGPVISSARPSTLMVNGVQATLQNTFHDAAWAMRERLAQLTIAQLLACAADKENAEGIRNVATHAPLPINGPSHPGSLNTERRA